jgi:hypothetical protein
MADIPQVLSNYDALVGVALGAGLTYGFGALNRRHQEARENETRWYNARFQAYVDLLRAVGQNEVLWVTDPIDEDHRELLLSLRAALGSVRLVGSDEVIKVANKLIGATFGDMADYVTGVIDETPVVAETGIERLERLERLVRQFVTVARKDLGHPSP